ncbi:hypothetical protein CC80DRAFT_537276 [Byssothecium circinans]|uniref:DUF676 domain-containing protein n=1 Tax=Byssothecium circinans TaxID=147558 RepID=A0A6A5TSI4_9PLEO|nr:hypothetical protein CC80DRAFT_537276 [Byssothecium circinans]
MTPDNVLQSYETRSADLTPDPAESELGQKNYQNDIRTIVTNREVKDIGLSVVGEVQQVGYGLWNGCPACLLAMKFYFRLADRRPHFEHFDISISFRKSVSSTHENADHPIVRCLTPYKVHGYSSVKRRARRWEIEKLYWDDINRANGPLPQPTDADDEHDTSITGRPWIPTRRDKPHQAVWTVTNDAKNGNWPLLDELGLSVVVEYEGPFEANVTISGGRSNRRLARILTPTWWSKDDPLLFNGKTSKGAAPRTLQFNELNEPDWLQITPFSELCRKSKPHTERDTIYRVRGIPVQYGVVETQRLLSSVCKLGTDMVVIGSLATSLHREENVATVSFLELPSALESKTLDEWSFEFSPDISVRDASDPPIVEGRNVLYLLIDTHFRGFTPLNSVKSPSEHKMDIIAVSGFGGHAFGSFKQKGGQYMWLRDSLPGDLKGARIIVYGHDSRLLDSASFQNISAIAGQLCSGLRSIRSFESGTSPQIPLVFIGHSLGGLLIKQALVGMAKGDESDRANLTSTYGALFFGTPNQGMNIDSLIAMVGDQPNRYFLETLGNGSEVLQNLVNNFNEVFTFRDSEVISFYETEKSKGALKVGGRWRMDGPLAVLVDVNSATQGRSWENTVRFIEAINRDHSNLVKFHRNDEDYERVLGHLRRFAQQATVVIPKRFEH